MNKILPFCALLATCGFVGAQVVDEKPLPAEVVTTEQDEPSAKPSAKSSEEPFVEVPEEVQELVEEPEKEWPPSGMGLFERGLKLGHIGDNPKKSYRRIFQRTLMPTGPRMYYNAVLTFDDQLVPFGPSEASAQEVVDDLVPLGARVVFFANVPGVAQPSLRPIFRMKGKEKRDAAVEKMLEEKRGLFIKTLRGLLAMKDPEGKWAVEIHNHTAFHQNMRNFKLGSPQMDACVIGLRFIEECLEEAYAAERPGFERERYFRFPFLAVPRNSKARAALNDVFTELGLISAGETQDSKDYSNRSPVEAYKSLVAARKGKRYSVKHGPYSTAEHPVALFHTKTWRDIGPGVVKALKEAKAIQIQKEKVEAEAKREAELALKIAEEVREEEPAPVSEDLPAAE